MKLNIQKRVFSLIVAVAMVVCLLPVCAVIFCGLFSVSAFAATYEVPSLPSTDKEYWLISLVTDSGKLQAYNSDSEWTTLSQNEAVIYAKNVTVYLIENGQWISSSENTSNFYLNRSNHNVIYDSTGVFASSDSVTFVELTEPVYNSIVVSPNWDVDETYSYCLSQKASTFFVTASPANGGDITFEWFYAVEGTPVAEWFDSPVSSDYFVTPSTDALQECWYFCVVSEMLNGVAVDSVTVGLRVSVVDYDTFVNSQLGNATGDLGDKNDQLGDTMGNYNDAVDQLPTTPDDVGDLIDVDMLNNGTQLVASVLDFDAMGLADVIPVVALLLGLSIAVYVILGKRG